ncbi:MAG: GAF domain-containing protein [Vicinamibacteria bacterium]
MARRLAMPEFELKAAYEERVRKLQWELARRDVRLAILSRVAARVHGEDDVPRILDVALDELLKGLGLTTAWVFLGQDKDRRLELAASRGVAPRYLAEVEANGLEECLCPEVFWSGHTMLARNTTQCPRMPQLVEGLQQPVAHACVPLRFEDETRGVLNVAALPGRHFEDDELAFLETVGRQICLAVERSTHLRAERARIHEARALASINRAIGSSLDAAVVLQAVGRTARELLAADRVQIMLGDDERALAVAHVDGSAHPEVREGLVYDLVELDARLLRHALAHCGTFVVEDWRVDPRVNQELAHRWQIAAAIVTCLRVQDRRLGLLLVSRPEPHRWPPEAVEVTEALASQASVALENARLYEEGKRAYRELKAAQDRIIRTEKLAAVGTFASGLAHEVRNPLNSVALQLSLLERRTAPLEPKLVGEVKELIAIIREEVRRLDRLVSDFLEFSRASRVQLRPTDVDALLDEVVRLLRPEAREREVTLRREQIGGPAPETRIDSEKMKQVVINLVRNAIEAMPAGGAVTVESGLVEGALRIAVRDQGPGLPEDLDVFQVFVTTKPGGTGLGLAIAQQIVLEHGGEILATSRPGVGATFTINLPVAHGPGERGAKP